MKMRIQSTRRAFPRINGNSKRNGGQPPQDQSYIGYEGTNNVNEVQRLTGRIATLSRFISKTTEKNLPFFKVLRKAKNFEWDARCQQVLEEPKKYLAGLPLLVKPIPRAPFIFISRPPPKLLTPSSIVKI
ncbi:UNVERIFIED_CONTAM: hypothetical protein Sangu_2509400 [Sesamum angustifolium]|uniref:Uncharacterized protein n=1 Tax=Sesamum angustifolium TaxID=2727405 RepID=A0AAW2JM02_9LAMI